jgi:cytochrome b
MHTHYSSNSEVRVWDPLVRVFHWTLVMAFAIAYISEDEFLDLHVFAGYVVAGLIAFRLLWGLLGSRHARFTDFVRRPSTVWAYIKSLAGGHPKRYLGHNPAGGAMVMALLLSLMLTVASGLAYYGAGEFSGPLAAMLGGAGPFWADVLEETHEFLANLTVVLVVFHVVGVVLASLQHRENLVRAMFTGRKRHDVSGGVA